MMIPALILAILFQQTPEELQQKAKPLIDKLRSDKIEERDEAMRELRKLGREALPLLRKLAQDPDLEFAGRLQTAIRSIDLREKLRVDAKETGTVEAASVVEWMNLESGRRVLSSEDLGLRNRRIRVTPEALETGGAFEVGVDLLRTVDLAVVTEEDDPKRASVVAAPLASKRVLKLHTSVDALPKTNEFCTLVVTVRHQSARDLQAAIINVISFPQNCLSVEAAGKLILSDYASSLRKLAKMIEQLDVPRGMQAGRMSFALLAGSVDATPSVPEPFKTARLADFGKNRFVILGEGFARLETQPGLPAPGPVMKAAPPAGLSLRLGSDRPYVVDVEGVSPAAQGVLAERITLRLDGGADVKVSPLLQTRLSLKRGEWTVAGAVPSEKDGVSLFLLVRADGD